MRIIAIDDGYFPPSYKARRGKTVLVAVKTKGPHTLEAAASTWITVDGEDATTAAQELAEALVPADTVILDGVTYAGFNYIDPRRLHEKLGIPVIVYEKYPLSTRRIENALRKHFPRDNERKHVILTIASSLTPASTPWRTIYLYTAGISHAEAAHIIRSLQLYSSTPEPLRIADLAASFISRTRIGER